MGLFDFLRRRKDAPAGSAKPAAPRASGPVLVYMDIDKLGDGAYGLAAGRAVARAVPAAMMEGMSLFSGDSRATLNGTANEYVVGIASLSGMAGGDAALDAVEDRLRADAALKAVLSPSGIRRGQTDEPLVIDGTVQGGALVDPQGRGGSLCGAGMRNEWERQAR